MDVQFLRLCSDSNVLMVWLDLGMKTTRSVFEKDNILA